MKHQQRIIVNFEHRLIQVCIFSKEADQKQKPLFFKNYFIEWQQHQSEFVNKLNVVLKGITEEFQIDVENIYIIFYDNHIITKPVSVEVMSRHPRVIDRRFFSSIKKNLLANSIIKKNYQPCSFWVEQIDNLERNQVSESNLYKNKVTILCDYLPNAEYKNILQLVTTRENIRNINLIPASRCVYEYFKNSPNKIFNDMMRSRAPHYIVHILDNRIVVFRVKNNFVNIFSSFSFGIMNVIAAASEQLKLTEKICLQLFFSTEQVYFHFANVQLLQKGTNKRVSLNDVRKRFVLLLYKQLLPVFTGEIKSVILMGRSVQTYVFMQFVDTYLTHIQVISDLTSFLREKNSIYFKLIGANCLLTKQDSLLV